MYNYNRINFNYLRLPVQGGNEAMKLKRCPKCSGNMLVDIDQYGWYKQCLQCGYLSDLKDKVLAEETLVKVKKYEKVFK